MSHKDDSFEMIEDGALQPSKTLLRQLNLPVTKLATAELRGPAGNVVVNRDELELYKQRGYVEIDPETGEPVVEDGAEVSEGEVAEEEVPAPEITKKSKRR